MMMTSLIRFTFSLLALGTVATSVMAQSGKVVLNASAMIGGPIARLGDVAVVEVADVALQAELANMELMPCPGADQSTYLTINDIRSILAARGISSSEIAVTGANRVRMQAASVEETIEAAAITPKRVPKRTFGGQILEEKNPEIIQVAYVVRNVRRGEIIRAGDVEMRDLSVVRLDEHYPSSLENVIGKEVTRGLAADRPVASEDVREPIIVRRNDVVTIFAHAGNVVVRREMMAMSDAGLRELVEVQPIAPQTFGRARQAERFQAQVTGPGEAIVLTGHVSVQASRPLLPIDQKENNR